MAISEFKPTGASASAIRLRSLPRRPEDTEMDLLGDLDREAREAAVPLRRCNDCVHHLGNPIKALLCPRFGMPRHNHESRCAQFRSIVLAPIPRPETTALVEALRAALNAVDLAKSGCAPSLRGTLDGMTERARATYARVSA